ncbi:MAG: hypothetical protein ACK4GB_07210 [Tepidimonas sp.]
MNVRANGLERIIAPVGHTWDSFFLDGLPVSEDFLADRPDQHQAQREAL